MRALLLAVCLLIGACAKDDRWRPDPAPPRVEAPPAQPAEPGPPVQTRAHRPGHYILSTHKSKGGGSFIPQEVSKRRGMWQTHVDNPGVAGFGLHLSWGVCAGYDYFARVGEAPPDVVTAKDYSRCIAGIVSDLDWAHAHNKKLYLWIQEQRFGGWVQGHCPASGERPPASHAQYFPAWLWDAPDQASDGDPACFHERHRDGKSRRAVLRYWDAHYRALFLEWLDQIGAAVGEHPALELVVLGLESTTGIESRFDNDAFTPQFDKRNHADHWKVMGESVQRAFGTPTLISINFGMPRAVGGGIDPAPYDDLVQWSWATGIGLSAPDLIPRCAGQQNHDGEANQPDCPDGFASPHYNPIFDAIIRDGSRVLNGFRVAGSDQAGRTCEDMDPPYTTDAGCGGTGQVGGYAARVLVNFANSQLQSRYVFWVMNVGLPVRFGRGERLDAIATLPLSNPNTENWSQP